MRPRIATVLVLTVLGAAPTYAANGLELFSNFCASCHGADGRAKTPAGRKLGAKDLNQSKLSDEQIAAQIANGKKNERGAERMPAFGDRLKPDEISALVEYVKTFRK